MVKKIGPLTINFVFKHRFQKGMDKWQKDRWEDYRLGVKVRVHRKPFSVLFCLYLVVIKTWVVFTKR